MMTRSYLAKPVLPCGLCPSRRGGFACPGVSPRGRAARPSSACCKTQFYQPPTATATPPGRRPKRARLSRPCQKAAANANSTEPNHDKFRLAMLSLDDKHRRIFEGPKG